MELFDFPVKNPNRTVHWCKRAVVCVKPALTAEEFADEYVSEVTQCELIRQANELRDKLIEMGIAPDRPAPGQSPEDWNELVTQVAEQLASPANNSDRMAERDGERLSDPCTPNSIMTTTSSSSSMCDGDNPEDVGYTKPLVESVKVVKLSFEVSWTRGEEDSADCRARDAASGQQRCNWSIRSRNQSCNHTHSHHPEYAATDTDSTRSVCNRRYMRTPLRWHEEMLEQLASSNNSFTSACEDDIYDEWMGLRC
eukprot:NODE_1364_length_1567_cov_21.084980_g1226_i0.p1 GENE.NODE_1364_length_1567_cov_21.084980_g1226_i0~~NODE_1364_length_1567_cov_21.084980_g1226_i0.p1  ORF type:complete len:254 (-),score=35.62 NODE_1364_length_1567_cov_21.084980_g1226_i0:702-1463(-)